MDAEREIRMTSNNEFESIEVKVERRKSALKGAHRVLDDEGLDAALALEGRIEFNPAAGEVMRPRSIDVRLEDEDDFESLKVISKVLDSYDLKVTKPDYLQPNFEYGGIETPHGETRVANEDVDYDVLARIVPDF